ncbi:DUF6496 domain-containing protein [Bosea thiooxidans]
MTAYGRSPNAFRNPGMGETAMPDKKTIEKARKDKREGKSPSTQAGEFVHEEIKNIRHGEHGARSTQQAIAIGLSEARRAGVDLPPPEKGKVKESTRKSAEYAYEVGQGERKPTRRPRVSKAVSEVLEHEPKNTASHEALSRQTKRAASRRAPEERSAAAKKAAETKGASERSAAARKAARTKGAAGRKAAARKAAQTRAHQG